MHVRNIDMLDEVLIACRTSLHAYAATVLQTVFGKRSPLDISEVRDGDHHILICIEVFRIELFRRECDLSPSCITILFLHLESLVLDDAQLHAFVCKDILAILDELHELVIFALELLPFKSGELAEPHLHDRSSLNLGESECSHKLGLCILDTL